MSRELWSKLETLIAWVVGLYFIYAAYGKIEDPAKFASNIKLYKLTPLWSVHAQALLMPWWELAGGLALLIRPWRRAGAVVVGWLLIVFIVAISWALSQGLNIECGCTKDASKVGVPLLIKDIAMLVGMWAILCYRPRETGRGAELMPATEPAGS